MTGMAGGCTPGRGPGREPRLIDGISLRWLVLDLLGKAPCHGYDLMKALQTQSGGSYNPSPGVLYPLLAELESQGLASSQTQGKRKRYTLTATGHAQLMHNAAWVQAARARLSAPGCLASALGQPVLRVVKQAVQQRLQQGPLSPQQHARLLALLDQCAQDILAL
jgi:DNA-binding PadR family transcriptional regulator